MCNSGGLMAFILAILRFLFKIVDYVKEHLLKAVFFVIFFNSSINMASNFSNGMQNRSLIIFFNIIITIARAVLVWVSIVTYVKQDAATTGTPAVDVNTPTKAAVVNTADIIKQAIIANSTPQPEIFLNTGANTTPQPEIFINTGPNTGANTGPNTGASSKP
jgi:hypothetical protein